MNTQTHLLLGLAVLTHRPYVDVPQRLSMTVVVVILIGAIFPDATLFTMWGYAKSLGTPESLIWSDWYYSETWQLAGAISNSIPLFLAMAVCALVVRMRYRLTGTLLLLFCLAALLHIATDFPLHNDDGRPHFWPISNWIYASPVSYWDSEHYANIWQPIELFIASLCAWVIWSRTSSRVVHTLLVFAMLSYAAMAFYWLQMFG